MVRSPSGKRAWLLRSLAGLLLAASLWAGLPAGGPGDVRAQDQDALTRAISNVLAAKGDGPDRQKALDAVYRLLPRVELPLYDYSDGTARLLKRLPPYYVWQEDQLLLKEEIPDRIESLRPTARQREGNPELTINLARMRDDFWPPENRRLTYAVNRKSFPKEDNEKHYHDAVKWLAEAAQDWVKACGDCGLSITHNTSGDDLPSTATSTFVVQYTDSGLKGAFAWAFFPSDAPSRRFLLLDKNLFTDAYRSKQYSPIGILRHELGHVLGFRHEHIHGTKGCERYSETDGNFRLLSAGPDIESIMHYRCGGAKGPDRLSRIDIEELRRVYDSPESSNRSQKATEVETQIRKIQAAQRKDDRTYTETVHRATGGIAQPVQVMHQYPPFEVMDSSRTQRIDDLKREAQALRQSLPPVEEKLTIRLDGGDAPANLAVLLGRLIDERLVGVTTEKVRAGDSICGLYLSRLSLPVNVRCPDELRKLAARLNPDIKSLDSLTVGQTVQLPQPLNINLLERVYVYDLSREDHKRQLNDRLANWKPWILREDSDPDIHRLRMREMEIVLGIHEPGGSAQLESELRKLQLSNVSFTSTRAAPTGSVFSRSITKLGKCGPHDSGNAVLNGPYYYLSMIDRFASENQCVAQCRTTTRVEDGKDVVVDKCPRIVFADRQVRPLADLRPALDLPATAAYEDPDDCREVGDFNRNDHHGTHLAGIMVASGASSGFRGLAPAARLRSETRWHDDRVLGGLIQGVSSRETYGEQAIFVFASRFAPYPLEALENQSSVLLKSEGHRFLLSAARQLDKADVIFVAAVGQPGKSGSPDPADDYFETASREITSRSSFAPANLGDMPNVIIATACENCNDQKAKLMPGAHYSRSRMVSVAAPGVDVPGLADRKHFAYGSGTSQAAAYVGGVAAAMATCSPHAYTKPGRLKDRMLVTARPVLDADDAAQVATGVVDPKAALLDPDRIWYRKDKDAEWKSYKKSGQTAWCASDITLRDSLEEILPNGSSRTESVLRISRYGRDEYAAPPRWVMFRREGKASELGNMSIMGPGRVIATERNRRLIRLGDKEFLQLADIHDLILPGQLEVKDCSGP